MKRVPIKPTQLDAEQIQKIESDVFVLVQPILDSRFYLLNVTFEKEAGYWYLRIYLEGQETPIALSDCEQVSRQLDGLLDELSVLQDFPYSLEVSSPGVFRPLKTQREFDFYKGRPICIKTIEPKKKTKLVPQKNPSTSLEGLLEGYDTEHQRLTLKNTVTGEVSQHSLTSEQRVYLNPILHFPEEETEI